MKTLRWLLACCFAVLTGCDGVPRPGGAAPVLPNTSNASPTMLVPMPPYAAWNRVLEKYVDAQGRVNFQKLAQDRADLDEFVRYVYDYGPNNQPQAFPSPSHVLAYHVNAYNALVMHKVLAEGIPESLSGIKKFLFFFLGKVQVGGEAISLYGYENKVIRPLGEARVHMALNCMSISCPKLPKLAFSAEQLEAQLQQETDYFVAETRNVKVDDAKQTVYLSEIFKFYTEDFVKTAPSLIAWVNRYRKTPVPENYQIEFTPYDWGINKQP
jgi:hypothetical protein